MGGPMATRATIPVAIVEDDPELRTGFTAIVNETGDLTCVGTFGSAEAALAGLAELRPRVVLMDIGLPGMRGIECVRLLKDRGADFDVLMLTAYDDGDSIFDSLQAGAGGYLVKRSTAQEIRAAIREAVSGGAPMSAAIARKVVQHFRRARPAPEVAALSDRERAVLDALSHGQRYKEVADTLGISMNTVRTHIKAIYDKLHVNSRAEAVLKLGHR
jgi:DNA-binding NarL/FixJ family response regulator